MRKQGFTLIELLVVILIIGILASIAVSSYQKHIARSKMANAMSLISSITTAQNIYYAKHGVFPYSFTDLDISLDSIAIKPHPTVTFFGQGVDSQDAVRRFKDYEIFISGSQNLVIKGYVEASAVVYSGKYKGAEFTIFAKIDNAKFPGGSKLSANTLYCNELLKHFKGTPGSFCEGVMNFKFVATQNWGGGYMVRHHAAP